MPSLQALADLPHDHPCLWGAIATAPEATWVMEPRALVLPSRRTGSVGSDWWKTRKQGALNRDSQPIEALVDQRGDRRIYSLPAAFSELTVGEQKAALDESAGAMPMVLYGGTLFDHFGHLILDLNRTYQLLRLFRTSKEPIWFHYPKALYLSKGSTPQMPESPGGAFKRITNPLIMEWLACLGLKKRARLVRKKLKAEMLVSSSVLYRDRQFVTPDFLPAAQAALAPKLRLRLLELTPLPGKIAYLSRHRLQGGTTRFLGEEHVVKAISDHPRIDVICPEELSISEKLGLYRRYGLIAGFPQACMNLKPFVPFDHPDELARQVMFIAGPKSLSSNWVNLDRACSFQDQIVDCTLLSAAGDDTIGGPPDGFQRGNPFNPRVVVDTLHALAR